MKVGDMVRIIGQSSFRGMVGKVSYMAPDGGTVYVALEEGKTSTVFGSWEVEPA